MTAKCIRQHRVYRGWDIFYERTHNGINWTARTDAGDKLRADTLAGLREAIRERHYRFAV